MNGWVFKVAPFDIIFNLYQVSLVGIPLERIHLESHGIYGCCHILLHMLVYHTQIIHSISN